MAGKDDTFQEFLGDLVNKSGKFYVHLRKLITSKTFSLWLTGRSVFKVLGIKKVICPPSEFIADRDIFYRKLEKRWITFLEIIIINSEHINFEVGS